MQNFSSLALKLRGDAETKLANDATPHICACAPACTAKIFHSKIPNFSTTQNGRFLIVEGSALFNV